MATKYELTLFVLFVFFVSGYLAVAPQPSFRTEKPEILSKFESIIEANDNHSIFCQGNKPLKWTTPNKNISWTTFLTQYEQPTSSDYQYGSRLYIINMTYHFVGFYYCHNEDVYENDEDESSSVYLYVNDNEHLSLLEGDSNIESVIVAQYQEAIIPCRPTSPDVDVKLALLTGEDVEDVSYDPKTGFSFFVTDLSQEQIYKCTFSRNSEMTESLVHLAIDTLPISHLPKPDLRDENEGHTVVGDSLRLVCKIKTSNSIDFQWSGPKPVDNYRVTPLNQHKLEDISWQTLVVHNVTIDDRGIYHCNVTDNQGHSSFADLDVKIFDVDEYFLNMSETNNLYSIVASAGDPSVQWGIDVVGHPRPTVIWLNNMNDTIQLGNGTKYEADYNTRSNVAFLKIRNIAITDLGYYKLLASNNKTERMLNLFLNVTDRPSVHIESEPFHFINTPSKIKCFAYANPEPEFEWEYKDCQTDDCRFLPINSSVIKSQGFEFISEVTINASRSGRVRCSAKNYIGDDEAVTGFYVSDVKDGFEIFGLDNTVNLNEDKMVATVAFGDTIRVTCGASIYNFSKIQWLFNDEILEDGNRQKILKSNTEYSNKIQLEIRQANYSDNGLYSCRVTGQNGELYFKNISFNVSNPQPPIIIRTNMKDEKEMNIPDKLVIYCQIFGIPKPTITWFKNGAVFRPSESRRIQFEKSNEKITFNYTNAKDEGTYKCEATNRMGTVYKQQSIKFKNLPRNQTWLIYVIVFLSLVCFGAIVFIIIKIRKEKLMQRELKKLGLANFEKGAVENINPELGIDDQAELLPYNQKWEFPIEQLKLGKQLGSGAFGVVMKGEAKHIVEGEPITTVAVKMVKKNADYTYIKALASELKVMVHLGKHLNVVNLLGACTKNVAKRELLVIVEYCRYGNLQNYLLRHRDNYIDQVNPMSGKIDYTIGQDEFDRSYSVSSDRSNTQSPSLKYAALTFSNSSNHPILPPSNSMGDYRENARTGASEATQMTTISQDDGLITSNNSVQPEWRSNYKGDYKGNVQPICTKDLLAWAFQVARGMEYLASRKVLHGDLAARNILLADNNVVKICDFGLAKSMYKNDNYKKRGDGPLPVKWMAIESIRDRIFSTQSDVWSFGIVLWEFFSLARTPYPGMEANERLYQKLVDGYRMESPEFAPREVYNMMTSCWAPKPLARPSFTKLSERIGALLEDSLRKHYIDLNDPYLVMNTQRIESGESDYLAMLSPPTFEALSSPLYVNENVVKESLEDSGYLSMKPNTVFSPRAEGGQVFDFNVSNRKHLSSEDGSGPELLPMLRRQSESDCDTPLPTPVTPNSFSNPSYLIPPKILEETKDSVNNNTDIVKTADNYVNMPQNKNYKEKESSNNPFVNVNGKGEVHYVNSNSKDWKSVEV